MTKAVVFNIMRYSVHDGPGIRTTVFFKGCPLSCKWCHNPESFSPEPQQIFNEKKCIKCGRCGRLAGLSALCPTGARETVGYEITLPELMKEIKKDLLFHEQSGGGVTFSGGEPLYQAEFLLPALKECRENYINTAIDTSGYCAAETMLRAAELSNYILYDVKFIDSARHIQYCGAPNALVLENLKNLAAAKAKLLIRIPLIPGINDDMKEMTAIFNFIKDFNNIEFVHLLPYHNIQTDKYKRMGMEYGLLSGISNDESPNMGEIMNLFSARFRTKIGG